MPHKKLPSCMLWAGTDHAFEIWSAAQKFASMTPAQMGVVLTEDPPTHVEQSEPESRLLQIKDGVALINVVGVTAPGNEWWYKYAGLVGYDEIREACHEAQASGCSQALFYFNSPGGSVAGVKDAVDVIAALGKVMPTTGYTDSQAQSAGAWLMTATRKRYASDTAMLGSIGVIYKHFEYSKMMEAEGETVTVVRAGEFKALANEVEPLSEKGRETLQAHADYLYGIFTGSIAELLGTSKQQVEATMAEGREFIGQQAVDVGLIDGIKSFDAVYTSLAVKAAKAANKGGNPMAKKFTSLTAAMAAMSAGLSPEDLAAGAEAQTPEAPVAPGASAESDTPTPDTEEAGVTPGAETTLTVGVELVADPAVVVLLQGQVKEANQSVLEAKMALQTLQASHDALTASVEPLKAIVAGSINTMAVALNQPKDESLASLACDALVSKYSLTVGLFQEKYKVGGVASAAPEGPGISGAKAPALSPVEQARLDGTRNKQQ